MATMTAFRLVGWQQAPEYHEVAVPVPREHEVLVEVSTFVLCHTDVHFLHSSPGAFACWLPFALGHEIAGLVVATGASARYLAVPIRIDIERFSFTDTAPACECVGKGTVAGRAVVAASAG